MSSFFIAEKPTPLLNTPDFQGVFGAKELPLDNQGLLRQLEMVALPGTKFKVLSQRSEFIYEAETLDYPYGPVFLDSRFVKPALHDTPEREKILPSKEVILSRLEKTLGLPYVWGGNWSEGIPELVSLYGGTTLSGLDCSGLLYEATSGFTPRNTSELLHFGVSVHPDEIEPLDLIIWPGHVIVVFDKTTTIESAHDQGGVIVNKLNFQKYPDFVIKRL